MNKDSWKIEWQSWSGDIYAEACEAGSFGIDSPTISVAEEEFGTSVVLDTPENRAALAQAAELGLGKNGLEWENDTGLVGTVPAHKSVRVP